MEQKYNYFEIVDLLTLGNIFRLLYIIVNEHLLFYQLNEILFYRHNYDSE